MVVGARHAGHETFATPWSDYASRGASVSEASKVSLVSRATITRFESGREIKPVLRSALQAAFERLGAVFTDHGVDIVGGRGGKGI